MSILLFTIILSTLSRQIVADGCTASVTIVERAGAWIQEGLDHHIYDTHIQNTGTCPFEGDISASITFPAGTSIGYAWGYNPKTEMFYGVPQLAPGQSYSGVGFITAGSGTPTATVNSVGTCNCGNTATTGSTTGNAGGSSTSGSSSTTGSSTQPLSPTSYYAIISAAEFSCWSVDQQDQVSQYELSFKVKTVILYTYPYATNGVSVSSSNPGGTVAGNISYAPAFAPFLTSLKSDASIAVSNVWIYPSTITDPTVATPALYITFPNDATQYVAAAFMSYPGGRKRLEFYFDQATWALDSAILGTAWVNWVSNGIFAGARRIVLNCHTDDVFMATGMYDPTTHEEGSTTYRLTPTDLDNILAWQQSLNKRMPAGSNFVLTFPFNGETIQEHGGYFVDTLYLKAVQIRDNFFWESHTWDHPDFDNLTYTQVYNEWTQNNGTALELFNNNLNAPNFNKISVITPSISGLFNGQALQAMWDLGIRNLCGDNSYPSELPSNPYHGWYTNVTSNGFAGLYIVPRQATDIYYDAQLPEHIVEQYNYFYSTNLTFDQIIANEVVTNTRNLVLFRHDPYMFHQANMGTMTYNGQTTSLLMWWVDHIVDSVMSYSTLPFNSYTHDDLAEMLHAREARDACGFEARLKVNAATNQITGLQATSQDTCTFPVSGVMTQSNPSISLQETVGDEKTVWISILFSFLSLLLLRYEL